ncbi:hypothetical protein KIW84_031288 [Lathyrus oleraceus]|uniref:Protein FAR1-RELATED SEQUENCE n=1 Tax=Pisum sativum TaxID=3888 RepID=A0A9D4XUX7_PEA|nr:hypothetical protein KIW84_031288 [Pisum sativum]
MCPPLDYFTTLLMGIVNNVTPPLRNNSKSVTIGDTSNSALRTAQNKPPAVSQSGLPNASEGQKAFYQIQDPGTYTKLVLETAVIKIFSLHVTAYSHFGDAVHLDTTCRANQYRVPFSPFTGVNSHGQLVLFGCALLFDDFKASFLWLFKTFLTTMSDRQPVSIITDQDRAIQAVISHVFPQTRHCINKWRVLREGQENLAHVCLLHPNFQGELYNFINLTETIEEFESSWNSILDKYELRSNDWLQSLYIARAQWAHFNCFHCDKCTYITIPLHLKTVDKNAKSSAGSDDRMAELHSQESLTFRYSNLCQEAIRYAEEGAVTVETYNSAVTGLKEGAKKLLQ